MTTIKQQGNETTRWLPQAIDDLTLVFPGDVSHLMLALVEIPEEFQRGATPWNDVAADWFFNGPLGISCEAKQGIDGIKALRHLAAILNSFQPKQGHKMAAVAYLMSLWFDEFLSAK